MNIQPAPQNAPTPKPLATVDNIEAEVQSQIAAETRTLDQAATDHAST